MAQRRRLVFNNVHEPCDYTIGATRVANNARGYVRGCRNAEPAFIPHGLRISV
jgi:hypothetical protein